MNNNNIYEIVNSQMDENKEVQNKAVAPEEPKDDTGNLGTEEIKIGFVTDCQSLNIRNEPKSDAVVLCAIPCRTEVMIDERKSTDEFYKVYTTSNIEGFCMKKYIAVQQ